MFWIVEASKFAGHNVNKQKYNMFIFISNKQMYIKKRQVLFTQNLKQC